MAADRPEVNRGSRRLVPGRIPDPLRAHGAWVYLLVSIVSGTMTTADRGWTPTLLAGGGFVGGFVLASAVAIAGRPAAVARLVSGLLVGVGSPLLALRLGADPSFLPVALIAVPPVAGAAWRVRDHGALSPGALVLGVTALTVAAPVAATAGGAPLPSALLILAILVPFFGWRTRGVARALGPGWTRERLRRRGLLESALAVAWGVVAVTLTRLLV